ncbi:DNA ligase 1-like [Cotesia glomerata]|uniref:DNA ligase 1-like n=1 Tax=Cotesia glomerata TaxID=32391 RepID=UPI001D0196BF|nr:DNA ligase 1-like [Cotesia glomerata]
MAGRGRKSGYNLRSSSQTDLRAFGITLEKKQEMSENKKSDKGNLSDGEIFSDDEINELDNTLIEVDAEIHQEKTEVGENSMADERKETEKDGEDEAQSQDNSGSSTPPKSRSENNELKDGAKKQELNVASGLSEITEQLTRTLLEKISEENRRKENEWELMLSATLNDINDSNRTGVKLLLQKMNQLEKCDREKRSQSCNNCKLAREKEEKIKKEAGEEKKKWEKEKETLVERYLKAESRVRELESAKYSARRVDTGRRASLIHNTQYRNEDYVMDEYTQYMLDDARARSDQKRSVSWSRATTRTTNDYEERKKRERARSGQDGDKQPRPLTEKEIEEEMKKREKKRLFLVIKHNCKTNTEAINIIKEKIGYQVNGNSVKKSTEGMLTLKMNSLAEKQKLMSERVKLRGTDVYLDDELTEREIEVAKWLREIEKEQREKNVMVKKGYMKICIDYTWKYWDERRGLDDEKNSRD